VSSNFYSESQIVRFLSPDYLMCELKLFRTRFSNSSLFFLAVFLVVSNLIQWDQIYSPPTHTQRSFRKTTDDFHCSYS